MECKDIVFTEEFSFCLQHHNGRIRVCGERLLNCYVMYRHTGPAPGIMRVPSALFQQDDARPHVVFFTHQIELLSCSPTNRKHVVHAFTATDPKYTTRSTLAMCGGLMQYPKAEE
ncbi:uncharacterized protein TNCV_2661641 [Trichonephila clavipes]|nr:uncharacterized protein TNCV_2661641 [Trichonephila clavipes]